MLSKKIISGSVLVLCFSIIGCKEEAKTTQWYRDHPDELKVVYEKCQKTGDASENCKNANEAHDQIRQLNAPTPDLNNLEE
ncbi:EexN family lipoprotein [Raoultella terrigena]|uniref:EexN family lipoprotein n=1 Tax=Raoultella terrigena TaxID=577 RepID=UPI001F5260AB|nr:EexN family lipoprotein [Raoultella terrigena]MCI1034810.1 EexN family lipoprotein [Raoultella terrigena]